MDKGNKGRGGEGTSKEKIFVRTSYPSKVSFFLQLMTLVVVGGEGHFSMNRNQAGHHSCAEAHKIKLRIIEIQAILGKYYHPLLSNISREVEIRDLEFEAFELLLSTAPPCNPRIQEPFSSGPDF